MKIIKLTKLIFLFIYLLILVFGYPIFKNQTLDYDNIIYIKKIDKYNSNIGLFQKIILQKILTKLQTMIYLKLMLKLQKYLKD